MPLLTSDPDPLRDLIYRPRLVEGRDPGSKGLALGLSALLYGALGCGLFALSGFVRDRAPSRVRSQAVVLQDFETCAPPPLPAGSPSAALRPASSTPKDPEPEMTPPGVATAENPAPMDALILSGPAQPAAGAPCGTAGGVEGGTGGGVAGGQIGGQVGSPVLPPRFDAAYLQNPEPDYPSHSRRLGEEGRVLLRVLVSAEGRPEQIELRQSSGHARLDQAALDTVRRWRFTPARRGNEALAAWVLIPLSFQLDA